MATCWCHNECTGGEEKGTPDWVTEYVVGHTLLGIRSGGQFMDNLGNKGTTSFARTQLFICIDRCMCKVGAQAGHHGGLACA